MRSEKNPVYRKWGKLACKSPTESSKLLWVSSPCARTGVHSSGSGFWTHRSERDLKGSAARNKKLLVRHATRHKRKVLLLYCLCGLTFKSKLPEITAVLPRRTGVGFGGSFQSANRVDQQSFISYSMHPEQGIHANLHQVVHNLVRIWKSVLGLLLLRERGK